MNNINIDGKDPNEIEANKNLSMILENKNKHKRDLSLLTSPALPRIEPIAKVGNN
jgi:hypothetical protein